MSFTYTGNPSLPPPLAQRAYLGVYTYTNPQGQIIPTRIRWEDGQEWEIDRVLDIRPGTARKAGSSCPVPSLPIRELYQGGIAYCPSIKYNGTILS